MPFNLGFPELLLVLVVVLVVFGPGKLPDIGSSLGRGIREFRKATSGDDLLASQAKKPEKSANTERTGADL